MGKETKVLPVLYAKVMDEAEGIVEELVSVFGVIDSVEDIVHPGAFTKTISERFNRIKVVDQHQTDSIMRSLGRPVSLKEIGVAELPPAVRAEFPEATGGLLATTRYNLDTMAGREAFVRIRDGDITERSFGFEIVKSDFSKVTDPRTDKEINVRNIREVKLWEYGPVLWGANPATATVSVKSEQADVILRAEFNDSNGWQLTLPPDWLVKEDKVTIELPPDWFSSGTNTNEKSAPPMQSFPLAPRNRAWDASAADARVRSWAGGPDDIDWQKYRRAHFYYDPDNAEQFGGYKFPYVDIIDGEPHAIYRGIAAGAARLDAADIPGGDKNTIRTRMSAWYRRCRDEFDDDSIAAPWDKGDEPGDEAKEQSFMQRARAVVQAFDDARGVHDYYICAEVFDTYVLAFPFHEDAPRKTFPLYRVDYEEMDGLYQFANIDDWIGGSMQFQAGIKRALPNLTQTKSVLQSELAEPEDDAEPGLPLTSDRLKDARSLQAELDNLLGESPHEQGNKGTRREG